MLAAWLANELVRADKVVPKVQHQRIHRHPKMDKVNGDSLVSRVLKVRGLDQAVRHQCQAPMPQQQALAVLFRILLGFRPFMIGLLLKVLRLLQWGSGGLSNN